MIEVIDFKGDVYPAFQSSGNAARFIIPFALEVCKGKGYDIGCCKEEWKLPNSIGIDLVFKDEYDATNLPDEKVDYIFSSHCLEHLPNWVTVLEYWISKLKTKGVLFLYLPHNTQKYWRPYYNKKHIHSLRSELLREFLEENGMKNIFISSYDLNNSFCVIAEKI